MSNNTFQTAAELIAFHGHTDAVRIATDQVRRQARTVTVATVSAVIFWAEVLGRMNGLTLAPEEIQMLKVSCSKERCGLILRLGGAPTSRVA